MNTARVPGLHSEDKIGNDSNVSQRRAQCAGEAEHYHKARSGQNRYFYGSPLFPEEDNT